MENVKTKKHKVNKYKYLINKQKEIFSFKHKIVTNIFIFPFDLLFYLNFIISL
jgi:hypothetical protein